jgi:hypothetical protein
LIQDNDIANLPRRAWPLLNGIAASGTPLREIASHRLSVGTLANALLRAQRFDLTTWDSPDFTTLNSTSARQLPDVGCE